MSVNFDNKSFIASPTTLQGDISNLINYSTGAYVLAESQDNQTAALARRKRWDKLVRVNSNAITLGMVSLAFAAAIFIFAALALVVLNFRLNKYDFFPPVVGFGILISYCAILGSRLWQVKKNQFNIDISNYNDECYQFRFMPDNKLYILVGANFDEKGESFATNTIGELEPVCSDLIYMDRIYRIKRYNEGVVIKGKSIIKSYRIINGLKRYMELHKPQYVTVFMQEGIYPVELIERISKVYGIYIK